ncbi:Serine/threonine-protein kinase BRSK2 [Dissostichus eleginoides]|uniref:Serine/threonine-protein kinase BRSK2 n=1 Tax=Dissostichus eleginoides TaxID=100907 RepID=A0AAD9BY62_DISEL|nr:Serine/threonine-protein kinase BRSK2 [Dissostichus eleginoides]
MSSSVKDSGHYANYVGPYRLEKTLGKGQTAEHHTDGGALEETLSLQIRRPVQQMVRQRQHVQTSLGATSNHVA